MVIMRKRTAVIWVMPKERLAEIVAGETTMAGVVRRLGLSIQGCHYTSLKQRIAFDGIDSSHIPKGKDSNAGRKFPDTGMPLEIMMVKDSPFSRNGVRHRLISSGIIPYVCQTCGQEPMWRGKKLALVLDHINGVNNDHRKENLRFLCPNCNSQTDTFCGRHKKCKLRACKGCGKRIAKPNRKNPHGLCPACFSLTLRRQARPSPEILREQVERLGYLATGRIYGVRDNTIRKWVQFNAKHSTSIATQPSQ